MYLLYSSGELVIDEVENAYYYRMSSNIHVAR